MTDPFSCRRFFFYFFTSFPYSLADTSINIWLPFDLWSTSRFWFGYPQCTLGNHYQTLQQQGWPVMLVHALVPTFCTHHGIWYNKWVSHRVPYRSKALVHPYGTQTLCPPWHEKPGPWISFLLTMQVDCLPSHMLPDTSDKATGAWLAHGLFHFLHIGDAEPLQYASIQWGTWEWEHMG